MDDTGDMEPIDCTADGTCGDEDGDGDEDGMLPIPEVTLMEETQNALQQFSIGLYLKI